MYFNFMDELYSIGKVYNGVDANPKKLAFAKNLFSNLKLENKRLPIYESVLIDKYSSEINLSDDQKHLLNNRSFRYKVIGVPLSLYNRIYFKFNKVKTNEFRPVLKTITMKTYESSLFESLYKNKYKSDVDHDTAINEIRDKYIEDLIKISNDDKYRAIVREWIDYQFELSETESTTDKAKSEIIPDNRLIECLGFNRKISYDELIKEVFKYLPRSFNRNDDGYDFVVLRTAFINFVHSIPTKFFRDRNKVLIKYTKVSCYNTIRAHVFIDSTSRETIINEIKSFFDKLFEEADEMISNCDTYIYGSFLSRLKAEIIHRTNVIKEDLDPSDYNESLLFKFLKGIGFKDINVSYYSTIWRTSEGIISRSTLVNIILDYLMNYYSFAGGYGESINHLKKLCKKHSLNREKTNVRLYDVLFDDNVKELIKEENPEIKLIDMTASFIFYSLDRRDLHYNDIVEEIKRIIWRYMNFETKSKLRNSIKKDIVKDVFEYYEFGIESTEDYKNIEKFDKLYKAVRTIEKFFESPDIRLDTKLAVFHAIESFKPRNTK